MKSLWSDTEPTAGNGCGTGHAGFPAVRHLVFLLLVAPTVPAAAASAPTGLDVLAAEVRDAGWIIYGARSTAGDWDLFRCRPDGSAVVALTRTPKWNEFLPQSTRDGTRLLYRRVPSAETLDNNRHGEQGELVLARSDGTDPVVLGQPGELPWASFNPDGTQLACLAIKGISFFDLAARRVVRTLPRKGFYQQMTWSPDGRWLVGVANSFGTGWSVARMNVATGEAAAVNTVDCCTPDWFPDSHTVIFSWRPPGQEANQGYGWTQLWRATVDGASRHLVYAEDGRHVYGGQVSPDGRYVVFTGNLAEDGDPGNAGAPMGLIRLADAPIIGGESRELRALHPGAGHAPVLTLPAGWEPCWTLGERVAEAEARPPADSLAHELHHRGWLVFSARSDAGDWDLFVMRPDGTDRRPLTATREFNEAGGRFAPDGSRLLYYRLPAADAVDNNTYGTFDLVLANADGSAPVVFGKAFPWASWGPDGRSLACLVPKGIRIVDVATRAVVREFPRRGMVSQLVWSPDGRRFAGTANGLGPYWNIGCLDPDAGLIHAVSETERYNCTPDWLPDGRGLVYARGIIPQQPGFAELWVATADGASRRRIHAEPGHHLYGACPSPDGRHVLFTRSREDLGQVPEIQMAVIRWPTADTGNSEPAARLDLGPGWEPHWSMKAKVK